MPSFFLARARAAPAKKVAAKKAPKKVAKAARKAPAKKVAKVAPAKKVPKAPVEPLFESIVAAANQAKMANADS